MNYEEASERLDTLRKCAIRYHGLGNVDCAFDYEPCAKCYNNWLKEEVEVWK